MKPVSVLSPLAAPLALRTFVTLATLVASLAPSAAWAASTTQLSFDERIALANAAQEEGRFHPYPEALHSKAGPQIARLMRRCGTSQPGARPFALVADIDARGHARNIVARPNHGVARCFVKGFASMSYLKPPAAMDGESFPIVVRVGHWR